MPNIYFNKITGDMSYELSFKEGSDTTFAFGFGLSGDYASERLINFTGISGKLFDQDGNFFHSYPSGVFVNLQGNCFTGRHNYTVDGVLTNTNCTRNTGSLDLFYYSNMQSGFGLNIRVPV